MPTKRPENFVVCAKTCNFAFVKGVVMSAHIDMLPIF